MNYRYLTGISTTLLAISLGYNAYQAYNLKKQNFSEKIIIYEKKITDAEEKARINKENLKILEERVENIERKILPARFTEQNKYNI